MGADTLIFQCALQLQIEADNTLHSGTLHSKELVVNCSATILITFRNGFCSDVLTIFCSVRHYMAVSVVCFYCAFSFRGQWENIWALENCGLLMRPIAWSLLHFCMLVWSGCDTASATHLSSSWINCCNVWQLQGRELQETVYWQILAEFVCMIIKFSVSSLIFMNWSCYYLSWIFYEKYFKLKTGFSKMGLPMHLVKVH